jgi:hypothetical protein
MAEVELGLYPIVTFQYSLTALCQVAYHIQHLFLSSDDRVSPQAESVRVLWASRTAGDAGFWRDQLEALQVRYGARIPLLFSYIIHGLSVSGFYFLSPPSPLGGNRAAPSAGKDAALAFSTIIEPNSQHRA